jgi:hypothetical protein
MTASRLVGAPYENFNSKYAIAPAASDRSTRCGIAATAQESIVCNSYTSDRCYIYRCRTSINPTTTLQEAYLRLPPLANLNSAGINTYSSNPPEHHNPVILMG